MLEGKWIIGDCFCPCTAVRKQEQDMNEKTNEKVKMLVLDVPM